VSLLYRAFGCFADPARRSGYFDLYSENVVLHGYVGVEPGLDSVKRYYQTFWSAFPDARVTLEEIVEQGETMAVRFLLTGTLRGPFLNILPRGQTMSVPGITMLRFQSGKCVERWSFVDSLSLLAQLGVNLLPQ
jgi:predicted ester cyclase